MGRYEVLMEVVIGLDAVRMPPTRHCGDGQAGLVSVWAWDIEGTRVNTSRI